MAALGIACVHAAAPSTVVPSASRTRVSSGPTITAQPTSIEVAPGASATFSVTATGSGALSYQWYSGTPGTGNLIAGAISPSWTLVNALAQNAGYYYVIVSDATGSTTSAVAVLTISPQALLGTTPGTLSVYVGQPFTLDANVFPSGGGNYNYYWEKNNNQINGAANSYYAVASASAGDEGTYIVVVSNGVESIESNTLTVTVLPDVAPTIGAEPQGATVAYGGTITLSVAANGGPPPTYQWYQNGTAIAGAVASTYLKTNAAAGDSGNYTVVVTNSAGSVTSTPAAITVSAPVAPVITTQPEGAALAYGSPLNLSVTATGQPAPTFQWYLNNTAIPDATGSTYLVYGATTANSGSYTVVVSNLAGTVTSAAAAVTVSPPVAPTMTTQPQSVTVAYEGTLSLMAAATGTPAPTAQWYFNGQPLAGEDSNFYVVAPAFPANSGTYTVVYTNAGGSVTSAGAVVTVEPPTPPTIQQQPGNVQAAAGSPASLAVTATGSGPLAYQWSENGLPIPGATTTAYHIASVSAANAGTYAVTITGPGGSITSLPGTLTVEPAPPPYAYKPSGGEFYTSVSIGSPGTRTQLVAPSSLANVTYQWYHNGQPIAGATAQTYVIASPQGSDAGDYFATLTSAGGTAAAPSQNLVLLTSSNNVTPPWVDVQQQGSVLYFGCASPAQICRYDLASGQWLAPVALGSAPTAILAAPEGLYVATGQTTALYALDLSSSQPLPNSTSSVYAIFANANYVYLASGSDWGATFVAANRSSLTLANTTVMQGYSGWSPRYAVSVSLNQVYGENTDNEPTGISSGTLNSDGSVSGLPMKWFADTPQASRYYTLNAGSVVADSGGTRYDAATLAVNGSFGPQFDDLCQAADGNICVLRGGEVTLYDSSSWAPLGSQVLSTAALRIFSWNGTVVACCPAGTGGNPATIETFAETGAVSSGASSVPAGVSPVGLAFLPFAWAADPRGSAYFLSKVAGSVFTYSTASNAWNANGIAVGASPNGMVYDPSLERLYLYYADDRITKIDLNGSGAEAFFAYSPMSIISMTAASGQLVVHASDAQDSGDSLLSFSASGALEQISDGEGYNPTVLYWDAPSQMLFGFGFELEGVGLSPQGTISTGSMAEITTAASQSLLRFSPDGTQMVDNSGAIWSTSTLTGAGTLGTPFTDAAWLSGGPIFTLTASNYASSVQWWTGSAFTLGGSQVVSGSPLGMVPLADNQVLAITEDADGPIFTLFGSSGQIVSTTALENQPLTIPEPSETTDLAAGTVTLTVPLSGLGLSYQWQINGADVAGATQPSLTLSPGQVSAGGQITLVVTNAAGTFASSPVTVTGQACRLVNLSALANIDAGNGSLTAGFYTAGGGSKQILFRGIGPALTSFDVPDPIPDPELTIFNTSATPLGANQGWDDSPALAQTFAQVGAFALPATSADAALETTLPNAGYTARVQSISGQAGEGMVEIYDADSVNTPTRLVNISVSAVTGASVVPLTAGFSIAGPSGSTETVLIRGVGPSLAGFGVSGYLAEPVLKVYDSGGAVIAANSGWGDSAALSAAFQQTGAFALLPNSADAAVVLPLAPGTYSAQVSSANGTAGVAMVEIYEVDP